MFQIRQIQGLIEALGSLINGGILSSDRGGTGNGFTKFSGPTTTEKTFTLPNANESVACLGQANTWTANQAVTGIITTQGSNACITLVTRNTGPDFVLYNQNSLFRLWSGFDLITVDTNGTMTMASTIIAVTSAAGGASIRLPHGSAPSSPVNGDVWTTTSGLYARVNGVTVGPFVADGGSSGTYTPTLTDVANIDDKQAYLCQYSRTGSVVTVSGRVDIDPALTATQTKLGMSLPVASNFANDYELGGVAFCPAIAGQGAAFYADAANNRAEICWLSGDISMRTMMFTFTYLVV